MERAHYGVREEIKDTADAFYRALSNKNLKAVEQVWAHVPYAAVAGRSGELRQGWEGVRTYWAQRFQRNSDVTVKVKLAQMVCHAVGDVGWLSGTEVRTITGPDGQTVQRLRVTLVLERQDVSWQIVSYHVSLPSAEEAALAHAS